MKRQMLKDRRGISPVITTVILVAVGIAIAVAISLWMSGLVGLFTRFEQLEIRNSYVDIVGGGSAFNVTVLFSNTGTSDTSVDSVLINGKPFSAWQGTTISLNGSATLPFAVPVGSHNCLTVRIPKGSASGEATLTSGVTVTVTIHSTSGKEYPTSVALP